MYEGSCLCGRVRYQIEGELGEFGYCHCRSCQKASGSAYAANAPIQRDLFRLISGSSELRQFESSPGKVRVFCGHCGSPLYAYLHASPEILRIRLGSLDTPYDERPKAHTWMSEGARWEAIEEVLPRYPEWAPRTVLHQKGSRQPK
jgi:hypothetical protein